MKDELFFQLNVFPYTWYKGLNLSPKTLLNFSLLTANHATGHLKTLTRWVKEVMENSGIVTEIFKHHGTRVTSNIATYKLGMPLQEVLKRGQWSNTVTFFTYCFRKIEESLDIDDQQQT